jgi:hypothetical protein
MYFSPIFKNMSFFVKIITGVTSIEPSVFDCNLLATGRLHFVMTDEDYYFLFNALIYI